MTRAERRRTARASDKRESVFFLTNERLADIKQKAEERGFQKAVAALIYAPIMVIEGHFPELMRKEVDGKSRVERFADMLYLQLRCVQDQDVSVEDLRKYLKEQYGIEIKWQ